MIPLKGGFKLQELTNLLWAMAKLVDHAQELIPRLKNNLNALLPCVSRLKDQLNAQGLAKLLWVMGALGNLISTVATETLVDALPRDTGEYFQLASDKVLICLWGLLACRARLYLERDTSNSKDALESLIDRLFTHLETRLVGCEQNISVMILAARWLGRTCPFALKYRTANSTTQAIFCAQLQSVLPSLQIVQEKSVHSLPPVDLLLPEHNIAVEIQGPSHYVGRDFQTRNGSTLLKIALLQKAGYDVVEIPVNQLEDANSVRICIDQIEQKTTKTIDNGFVLH